MKHNADSNAAFKTNGNPPPKKKTLGKIDLSGHLGIPTRELGPLSEAPTQIIHVTLASLRASQLMLAN